MRGTIKFHREINRLLTNRLRWPISPDERAFLLKWRDELEERLDFLVSLEREGQTEPIIYV